MARYDLGDFAMSLRWLGQSVFGASMAAIGALILGFPGFASGLQAALHWLPGHDAISMIAGAIMLASGLALLIPSFAAPASLVLAAYLLLHLLFVPLPSALKHALTEVYWEPVGENLAELGGALAIFAMASRENGGLAFLRRPRLAQSLFGLALLPIGLSHFFFLKHTAELIPAWLPYHVALAEFTGAAHFAAGAAILAGVLASLAATLEAVMVSLFTLVIWVPAVIAQPLNVDNLGEICASTAISGAAWAIAESFRTRH